MWGWIGRDGALVKVERPTPEPGPGQVRIRVAAAGVNRADLMQLQGAYPPPPGASDILGLECAGTIDAIGPGVTGWQVDDRVAALLTGGGYASHVLVPAGSLLPVAADLPWVVAAALPEALATVRTCLDECGSTPVRTALWHAGASGIGTTGVQVCRVLGIATFVTAGTADKIVRCRALGAAEGWVRDPLGFVDAVRSWSSAGVDLIVDPVGGPYLSWNQEVLAQGGTLVSLSFLGGRTATLDLGRLLMRRQRVIGTTLRSRPDAEKASLVGRVRAEWWDHVAAGRLEPVVDSTFPLVEPSRALDRLATGATVGKVVLTA